MKFKLTFKCEGKDYLLTAIILIDLKKKKTVFHIGMKLKYQNLNRLKLK